MQVFGGNDALAGSNPTYDRRGSSGTAYIDCGDATRTLVLQEELCFGALEEVGELCFVGVDGVEVAVFELFEGVDGVGVFDEVVMKGEVEIVG